MGRCLCRRRENRHPLLRSSRRLSATRRRVCVGPHTACPASPASLASLALCRRQTRHSSLSLSALHQNPQQPTTSVRLPVGRSTRLRSSGHSDSDSQQPLGASSDSESSAARNCLTFLPYLLPSPLTYHPPPPTLPTHAPVITHRPPSHHPPPPGSSNTFHHTYTLLLLSSLPSSPPLVLPSGVSRLSRDSRGRVVPGGPHPVPGDVGGCWKVHCPPPASPVWQDAHGLDHGCILRRSYPAGDPRLAV